MIRDESFQLSNYDFIVTEYIIACGLPRGTNSNTGSAAWFRVIFVVVPCE